jgi:hypothetical protein
MKTPSSGPDWTSLVNRVFPPLPGDRAVAFLVDLPDPGAPDTAAWRWRRGLVREWAAALEDPAAGFGMPSHVFAYRNVGRANADLPPALARLDDGPIPDTAEDLPAATEPLEGILSDHGIVIAPTEFSATAPLKNAARRLGFRGATMPGFSPAMLPALDLDYGEVNRRVDRVAALLDAAEESLLVFRTDDAVFRLRLDLRFRSAHASGGVFPRAGMVGNLPSGEAYIVPYEGENEPSRSGGILPVQFGNEVVCYRITGNRAIEVLSRGPESEREAALLAAEPAYGNLAELGLGVLGDLGVAPTGDLLLDEKLGLHIAFGRSDHFGGRVGPGDFTSPAAVVHIDRVYVPAIQPRIHVASADLAFPDGKTLSLIHCDRWILDFQPGSNAIQLEP